MIQAASRFVQVGWCGWGHAAKLVSSFCISSLRHSCLFCLPRTHTFYTPYHTHAVPSRMHFSCTTHYLLSFSCTTPFCFLPAARTTPFCTPFTFSFCCCPPAALPPHNTCTTTPCLCVLVYQTGMVLMRSCLPLAFSQAPVPLYFAAESLYPPACLPRKFFGLQEGAR